MGDEGVRGEEYPLFSGLSLVVGGYVSPLFVSKNGDEGLVKLGTDISMYVQHECITLLSSSTSSYLH